jgi:adenylosuccinate lyase
MDSKEGFPVHSSFSSVFSERYASERMRGIFSELSNRLAMRRVWSALAYAQMKAGIVSKAEYGDIEAHAGAIDIARSLDIEKETGHDVVAEIRCYSEQCRIGGGKIHLGATSEDILGNAQVLQQKEALAMLGAGIKAVLAVLARIIEKNADRACMAYTHMQPAEPTTVGYRFSFYAQDLLGDLEAVKGLERAIRGKGFKGAVGTGASYAEALRESKMPPEGMEKIAMEKLGLSAFEITTQTYPRKQDYKVLCALAQISQSLAKMALDIRVLQSPMFGELSEPFGKKQVGSSAMPFKRNPVNCEKVCSLSRLVQAYPQVALENADYSILERTLDDSANRRVVIPEAFLAVDEMLITMKKVLSGLVFDYDRIGKNFSDYALFAGTERLLSELVRKGADRQKMHEAVRECSMKAWEEVKAGKGNPLASLLAKNREIAPLLDAGKISTFLDVRNHTGFARERSAAMAKEIRAKIAV